MFLIFWAVLPRYDLILNRYSILWLENKTDAEMNTALLFGRNFIFLSPTRIE